jgi:hypothetical protein
MFDAVIHDQLPIEMSVRAFSWWAGLEHPIGYFITCKRTCVIAMLVSVDQIATCSFTICSRFHFLIFSGLRNKAVADGAVSFYLDHYVTVRVASFNYGVICAEPFNNANPAHLRRLSTLITRPSGREVIPHCWSIILPKVQQGQIVTILCLMFCVRELLCTRNKNSSDPTTVNTVRFRR